MLMILQLTGMSCPWSYNSANGGGGGGTGERGIRHLAARYIILDLVKMVNEQPSDANNHHNRRVLA